MHRHRRGDRGAERARPGTPAAAPTTRGAAIRPVAIAATTSSATKPTAKFTRAGEERLAGVAREVAVGRLLQRRWRRRRRGRRRGSRRAGVALCAAGRGDDRGDRERHAGDPAGRDALAPGRAQPDAVGHQAARVWPQTSATLSSATPIFGAPIGPGGDEHRAAEAAEQVPAAHARRASAAPAGWRRSRPRRRRARPEPDGVVDGRRDLGRADRLAQPAVDVGLHRERDAAPPTTTSVGSAVARRAATATAAAQLRELRRAARARRGARRGRPAARRSATRSCASESRSRTVTVRSSSDWWSIVTQNGVPISSWRR